MIRRAVILRTSVLVTTAVMLAVALPAGAVGGLTWRGCVSDSDSGGNVDNCGKTTAGMLNPDVVVVSPDGKNVYAAGQDNSIVILSRSKTGALSGLDCVGQRNNSPVGCSKTTRGLTTDTDIVISPDGKFVYVVSHGYNAITSFKRDRTTGLLHPLGCIADTDHNFDSCPTTTPGLNGANAAAISPDGSTLYVAGLDALVRFDRDATTGLLTPHGCVREFNDTSVTCGSELRGLGDAKSVVVSPDGKSVYTASPGNEALDTLKRSKSGFLTPVQCLSSQKYPTDNCSSTSQLVANPSGLVLSGDSKWLYLVGDGAIVRFRRDTTSGLLSGRGCIGTASGDITCATNIEDFGGVVSVAISPDGRSIYAVDQGSYAIHRFDRDVTTGALTWRNCINDTDLGSVCPSQAQGLAVPMDVAVSPDGISVYVAADQSNAVTRFDRAA